MWDRHYWRATRPSFRYQQRQAFRAARDQQRQAYKAARRSYRHGRHRGNPFFGLLLLIVIASLIGHAWFLIPLAIIGGFVFMWLRGNFGSSSTGHFGNNYQQNQYYQQQPNQYYQPSNESQANTPYTPPYQPYEQGYQTLPKNDQQQNAQPYQPYQNNPAPSTSEQYYEEPQAQYPQETPPMV